MDFGEDFIPQIAGALKIPGGLTQIRTVQALHLRQRGLLAGGEGLEPAAQVIGNAAIVG